MLNEDGQIQSQSATLNSAQPAIAPQPNGKSPVGLILGVLLVVLLSASVAGFGGYKLSDNKAKKSQADLKTEIVALQSKTHTIPADAIKVSDCIPNMGAHFLPKGSDPQYGPFILGNKAGQAIGVEYMAAPAMFTAIPKTDPPVEIITKASPMYGWSYDHSEQSHLPKGHEGFLINHTDIHLFTVSLDEQSKACI